MADLATISDDEIVVTGLGAVSGGGWGWRPLWRTLLTGETVIRPVERFDVTTHRTRHAAEVPDAGPDERLDIRAPSSRWWSLADRYAIGATVEALDDAGLTGSDRLTPAGVYFASSTGGMWKAESFFAGLTGNGPRRPAKTVGSQDYSGPGDAVARYVGCTGPVESHSTACSSSTLAIGAALDALRDGEIDIALAGGSDGLCQLTYAGFNSLRAVAAEACRPFRGDRDGMSLGEGAAVLVLETARHARARGASAWAVLAGAGGSCDAGHMTAPSKDGEGPKRAVEAALADAALDADAIAFVNAHGTGTPRNDAAEAAALGTVFGARIGSLPITSTKGSVGHLLGSAGSLEALVTVLSLVAGVVPPTPGDGDVDPAIEVDLVRDVPRQLDAQAHHGLTLNLAFGGANAALIFSRACQS